jgi:hypothetical protein
VVRPATYNLPRALLTPLRHTNLIDRRLDYARLFCGLLMAHLNSSEWGECGRYLELPGQIQPDPIASFTTAYRILVVPGAFSDCAEKTAPAFQPGIDHLIREHQIDAFGFTYGGFYDATESGKRLADHIDLQWKINQRPFILVGYSKGAADALEAFVQLSDASTKIAALISVAGAVDGSRLPDLFSTLWRGPLREVEEALRQNRRCITPDDAIALRSLSRKQRMEFLEQHSFEGLRRYSIAAAVPEAEVSRVLKPLWRRVSPYSIDQDSQVIVEEGILPRANVLGIAKGDHWAVAMPFSELNDDRIDRWVNKNRFPRTILLEAAIRLVVRDLL